MALSIMHDEELSRLYGPWLHDVSTATALTLRSLSGKDPYAAVFKEVNLFMGNVSEYVSDPEISSLLDGTVQDLLSTILPDAMRWARWAATQVSSSPAIGASHTITVFGPHVASALSLHPLLGDADMSLLGFAMPEHAPHAALFPLARDLLTVVANQGQSDAITTKPVPVRDEKASTRGEEDPCLKLLPKEWLRGEITK